MKATAICLWSTKTISPHRTRNTSIRTRKMRGEDNLNGSMFFGHAVRMFAPRPNPASNMAQTRDNEKAQALSAALKQRD